MAEVWYRAEVEGYVYGYDSSVYYNEFEVVRHTKCGVWLDYWGRKRFCQKRAPSSFAKPTKADALISLICRRERQIKILNDSLETATAELAAAMKEAAKEVAHGDNW